MKKKFYISFIISIMIFAVIFVILDSTLFSEKTKTVTTDIYGDDIDDNDDNDESEQTKEPKEVKDEILFLMLGVDNKDLDKHSNIRTDTMILTRVNFKTGKTELLSIPRDTRTMVRGKLDKINHAHSFGGVDLTLRTVREFLNIDLDYYVKINYEAVKEIVNAIGGVEIDVPRRMKYDDTTKGKELHIDIEKGLQTLNGDKSLEFLRWRKNNDGSGYPDGDVGRIKAQQIFIKELVDQTFSLKNIFKIPRMIKTYYDYVDTNIPLKTMLKATKIKREGFAENMNTNTIPGDAKMINGVSYYIYDEEGTRELVEEMFGDYVD